MVHSIGGVSLLPSDNLFNTRVDALPTLPQSATMIATLLGQAAGFQVNVSTPSGGTHGIPYNLVNNSTPTYIPTLTFPSTSYTGAFPVPNSPLIESDSTDHHLLCLNTDTGVLYEMSGAVFTGSALSGTSAWNWPMNSDTMPAQGSTAACAASLPILPGLLAYDEINSGAITHALYMIVPTPEGTSAQKGYIWPAVHGDGTASNVPAEGMRVRLKASFNILGYSAFNQTILTALKQYGAIIMDKGAANSMKLQGVPDARWNNSDLAILNQTLDASKFEVVNQSLLQTSPTSMAVSTSPFSPELRTYSNTILADNPLCYLRLGELSGLVGYDSSPNGYNGTYVGGITLGQQGVIVNDTDPCILGNGSTGFISFPPAFEPAGFTAISLEWWWKISSFTADIVSWDNQNSSAHTGFVIFRNGADSTLHFQVGNGTTFIDVGSVSLIATGVWEHWVVTGDATSIQIYKNGVLDKTGVAMPTILASTASLFFGFDTGNGSGGEIPGLQDEAALYAYKLSGNQVQRHYLAALSQLAGSAPLMQAIPTQGIGYVTGGIF